MASAAEMTRLYEHFEQVLDSHRFPRSHRRRTTCGAHSRLFNRALLDQNEMNILRGVLTAVQARRRPAKRSDQVTG